MTVRLIDVGGQKTDTSAPTAAPVEPGFYDAPLSRQPVTEPLPLSLLVQLEKPAQPKVSRPVVAAKTTAKVKKALARAVAKTTAKVKKAAVKAKAASLRP